MRAAAVATAVLGVAFVLYSGVVAAGLTAGADLGTAHLAASAWSEPLHVAFQAVAVLGGIELTGLLTAGLAFYLWRGGFRREAWVVAVVPAAILVELAYKRLVTHSAPGAGFAHADGPSLSELLLPGVAENSFPSGHVVRTTLVYGLVTFVAYRLMAPGWRRGVLLGAFIALCVVMIIDRVYLGVHWESDAFGGFLLGGLFLAAAVAWLDRPGRSAA